MSKEQLVQILKKCLQGNRRDVEKVKDEGLKILLLSIVNNRTVIKNILKEIDS